MIIAVLTERWQLSVGIGSSGRQFASENTIFIANRGLSMNGRNMTPFKLHLLFGILLIAGGILFDFLFVQWKVGTQLLRTDPNALASWAMHLYNLTKFYIITLGIVSMVLALLIPLIGPTVKFDWAIFCLFAFGTVCLIWAGAWYASAGQSLKWEPRCTLLTIGLAAIVISLGLEMYKILSLKNT